MRALYSELPFQSEIPFGTRLRVGRDDRDEQGAIVDLSLDLAVPQLAAPQFALVEPNLNASCTECVANALRGLRILRSVT
jgi:hypothetical protein